MSHDRSRVPIGRRLCSLPVAVVLSALTLVSGATPASAVRDPAVTSTTTTTVPGNETSLLAGVTVVGLETADAVNTIVSTDRGTLTISETSDLTLDFGNNWTGDASIGFSGTQQKVNAGLATLSLTTPPGSGTADISITALPTAPGFIYAPSNGHFYEYIASPAITWTTARSEAKERNFQGQDGYLATIPSAEVNDLVGSRIQGATNIWFGANSIDTFGEAVQRTWQWADGPLAEDPVSLCSNWEGACDKLEGSTYDSWASGEPNNCCWEDDPDTGTPVPYSGEPAAVTNWGGGIGNWNDLPYDNGDGPSGYLVEYGDLTQGASSFSDVVSDTSTVAIIAITGAPTDVAAVRGDQSAEISFIPGDSNGNVVSGYAVSTSPGGAVTNCAASPCVVNGLTNGTSYTFTVVALSVGGDSSPSAPSNAVIPAAAPDQVTGVTAVRGNGRVGLTFDTPDGNGSAITEYVIKVGDRTLTCTSSPCTVTGLENGTAYTFTVKARNDVGDGEYSDPSNEVTPASSPSPPQLLSVASTAGALVLSFAPEETDGGSPVTGYQVSLDDGETWRALTVSGTSPKTATVAGLVNGRSYRVSIRAVNSVDGGEPSDTLLGTPATVPGAPRAIRASKSGAGATVTWVAPAFDGGSPITAYKVTASPGGKTCRSTTTSCTVAGLRLGVSYTFSVVADNTVAGKSGTGVGPAAVSGSLRLSDRPGAPRGLRATPGDRTLKLSWQAPLSDGGNPITGYEVSLDNGRTWKKVSGSPRSITIAPVLNGTSYTAKVRAVNSNGKGAASGPVTTRVKAWFSDPVSAAAHKKEVAVPRNPKSYRGPKRQTKATARSRYDTIAYPDQRLDGRQLQRGQAINLGGASVFAFDSGELTKQGRARVKAMASSLRYVSKITCEGYADYAGNARHELNLSEERARTVCNTVKKYAKQVTSRNVRAYGNLRPVVVGGKAADRAANRRVVVVVR